MNKSSKAAAVALALSFSFLLPACHQNSAKVAEAPDSSVSEESPQTSEPTPKPTPEPVPEPVPEPTPEPVPEPTPKPTAPAKNYASYIKCTGKDVNIRSGASTDYAVLGTAEEGAMYVVTGKIGNWYITYYQNKTAYINAAYLSVFSIEKSDNSSVEDVIWEGYKTLGVPYVYGAVRLHDGEGNFLKGFTTSKFDCSSLVQYAFYKGAGVLLQTTTRSQVVQGKHVERSEIKRGDCIYFTNASRQYNTGIERVGHVAVYLGDNYILHTSSDYARIEKLNATRWSYYIETRRFL